MANPADPAGWPGNLVDPLKPDQKPGCDPLIIFYFYQNDIVLIYKKIEVDPIETRDTGLRAGRPLSQV